MPAPPLTHHEILDLVEPFTRRGRHVDLAASQRQERRLVFKPPSVPADTAVDAGRLQETLQLECLGTGTRRLTRRVTRADGLQATLHAQGPDVGAMLAQVEAVPAVRHFVDGPGFHIARSYALDDGDDGRPATLTLMQGSVHVDGLVLTLAVPAVRNVAGNLTLVPAMPGGLVLPEDLLAVLGWNWTRLVRSREGWTSKLRLRGRAEQRNRRAEAALTQAAAHLARTLAEPPACFHERLRAARWGVFFRRGIPTFTAITLLLTLAALAHLDGDRSPGLWMALYHVPTLLVALSFCLQELPRFEIPPWPRRLTAPAWRTAT
jgi:hypothetical protein